MKKIFLFVLPVFLSGLAAASDKGSLSGKITDKTTGQALQGAYIALPDLKRITTSAADGSYRIDELPLTSVLVQVSFKGYKTIIETIDLTTGQTRDFALEASITEINEIVVTGHSFSTEKNKTPTPISIVPQLTLLQTPSSNIIDALASQPGLSQVTTGSSISKPVIRGLGYNRVVVVVDGIRQEGQQWGDEHGIEVDEFSVHKVEILKGPASLMYGSDAMAGVINMFSLSSLPEGGIKGNLLGNYQLNNGQIGYSASLAGNLNGFIWDLRYSAKQAHSYRNRYDGYVYGSAFRENAISGIIGLNKVWGYTHLHLSTYHLVPGIVEGERDSATGRFTREFALNDSTASDTIASDEELRSYDPGIPRQDIRHHKLVLNNSFVMGNGSLKVILGFQQNHRQEYANVLAPDEYELYFLLNTVNYGAYYVLPVSGQWSFSLGVSGMSQTSQNRGEEFLVPEYGLFDIGGFATFRKSYDKLDISGGLRFDTRTIEGKELLLDTLGRPTTESDPFHVDRFSAFSSSFSSTSGSLGLSYAFSDKFFAKLNLARGFRAPNIAELGSNGEHEGTLRYEIGNPFLKAETSLQTDLAFGLNTEHVSAELDLFYNGIDHFIYAEKLYSVLGGDSVMNAGEPVPVFKYTQGDAALQGGEVMIDIHPHPLDWLHFESAFSWVLATQKNVPDSMKYLPLIPAPRFSSELRGDFEKAGKFMANAYVRIGVESYLAQDRFYKAFGTETRTPGYTLLSAGLGADFVSGRLAICSVYISINNLTDVAYQSHLSRLKYAAENPVTGRTGIYNMGRNISFKLVVPVNIRETGN
ncbi:MAG: TonB-dependent receptor [Bacteroidota bacterium]